MSDFNTEPMTALPDPTKDYPAFYQGARLQAGALDLLGNSVFPNITLSQAPPDPGPTPPMRAGYESHDLYMAALEVYKLDFQRYNVFSKASKKLTLAVANALSRVVANSIGNTQYDGIANTALQTVFTELAKRYGAVTQEQLQQLQEDMLTQELTHSRVGLQVFVDNINASAGTLADQRQPISEMAQKHILLKAVGSGPLKAAHEHSVGATKTFKAVVEDMMKYLDDHPIQASVLAHANAVELAQQRAMAELQEQVKALTAQTAQLKAANNAQGGAQTQRRSNSGRGGRGKGGRGNGGRDGGRRSNGGRSSETDTGSFKYCYCCGYQHSHWGSGTGTAGCWTMDDTYTQAMKEATAPCELVGTDGTVYKGNRRNAALAER